MTMDREKIAEILLTIGAVRVSGTHPFTYASGLMSPIYTNCRILASYPRERKAILDAMIERVEPYKSKIDTIASCSTSSMFLASLLSQRLEIPMVYVRSSRKTHGKGKKIEGVFGQGRRALLVSDIVSTEMDIPRSIEAIRNGGGIVEHCLGVFDNNIGMIEPIMERNGISCSTLTDLQTLLEVASAGDFLPIEKKTLVEDWLKNPRMWNERRKERIEEMLEKTEEDVSHILLEIRAVTVNVDRPIRYTSGILSPIYTDNRLLISHPNEWRRIIDYYVDVITNVIGLDFVDVIAGTATSGIPHAALIAEKLDLPMVYVWFEQTQEGKVGRIEGKIEDGNRIVMIEDHVTTGASVISSARVLRDSGANVDWCVAIFTYDTEKSKSTFAEEELSLLALCNLSTLMDVAVESDYITEQDKKEVFGWLENPQYWALERRTGQDETHESEGP